MVQKKDTPILAVIFDLDDTLYPERDYVRSGYRAVAEHLRGQLGRNEPFEAALWKLFQAGRYSAAFDELNHRQRLGLGKDDIAELVAVYRSHRPTIQPYEGTAELLGRLHADYRLGLLSDGFLPAQQLKLQALGLGRFFDAVVFTEELGREAWKPSPAGFEAVAKRLGAPHESCAYVGDNPAKDFLAPNALGWLTVQVLHPGQIHAHKPAPPAGRPQRIASDGGELIQALREVRI